MFYIKRTWRWIKFHLKYKRKFTSTPGIPSLCSNYRHPYHESKFEHLTCNVLRNYFKDKDVLVPENHKYKIKFDFIVKGVAIIEPHGIWSNNQGDNTYFDYYKKRRSYADQNEELKSIPLIVLTNSSDLAFLKKSLKHSSNYKASFLELSKNLLEKYHLNLPEQQSELLIGLFNKWIILILVISILLNIYFIFRV